VSAIVNRPDYIPATAACDALGVSSHRLYLRKPRPYQRVVERKPQPRKLTPEERANAFEVMHSERFCDAAPRQIVATLASEGKVIASASTLYRLLRERGETRERRAQRPPQRHAVPRLSASAPNQIWTWDITKLATMVAGVYLSVYVILDLYSRYVVGWMVSVKENAGLAKILFANAIKHHAIAAEQLTVHQDRGAPMTANTFRELLAGLGVEASYSRPRVSNDNAHSESHFKTLKYAADFPGRFADAAAAREWLRGFFEAYHQRPHQGLAMYTPEQAFNGTADQVWKCRQAALDRHYEAHPERYPNGAPKAQQLPLFVAINPLDAQTTTTAAELIEATGSFASHPPPTELPDSTTIQLNS
jgi:putative transposase